MWVKISTAPAAAPVASRRKAERSWKRLFAEFGIGCLSLRSGSSGAIAASSLMAASNPAQLGVDESQGRAKTGVPGDRPHCRAGEQFALAHPVEEVRAERP